jgi:hypothetical protein
MTDLALAIIGLLSIVTVGFAVLLQLTFHRLARANSQIKDLHRRIHRITTAALVLEGADEHLVADLLDQGRPISVEEVARAIQSRSKKT